MNRDRVSRQLRICLLANVASIHTQRWASYFIQKGHEVHIISLSPGALAGANVYHVPWWRPVKQIGYLLTLPRIRNLVRKISPDILHAHYAISYGVLGALTGYRPLAIGAWGSDLLISPGSSKIIGTVLRYALKQADLVTSLADHITQALVDCGVQREKIRTVPFGVDTRVFRPARDSEQAGEADIICTRSFDKVYNIELLLHALSRVITQRPDLTCIFAGDGPQRESLKALARELGLERNVRWLGWISPQQLAGWLRNSKVYVSPSLSDGTSTCLTEAMACGCFPVTLDIPANRPWVEDGKTGFLVRTACPELMANHILKALDSDALRRSAAKINWETVEKRADFYAIMSGIEEDYLSLAAKTPR